MKKADYNRIISLYHNTDLTAKTCVQLIIQISKDQYDATERVFEFLKEIHLLKELIQP